MSVAPTARLFVALWPDERGRDALAASASEWHFSSGAARVRPERLHLTLHFLGAVDRGRLPELRRALAQVNSPRFTLMLSRPALWPGGIAVLEPVQVPPALAQLHTALARALLRLGLPVETRPFRPHVTLARRAGGAAPLQPGVAVDWPVDAHVLVESRPGGDYFVVGRRAWPERVGLECGQRDAGDTGVE